ncbi:hypothetical protein [Nonomuraea phyllanthi]|uniref:hypothetical protein n=1 Tax=Nonomuraea phyllanthi TaxID=2219224 RepID=UPI00186B3D6A|nr:hypothetical protein [Nonomuraea phyllanthi]
MPLVRIVVDGHQALVYSPFDAKDLVKSMPDRKWSPGDKAWIIPAYDVDDLKAVLEASNYTVVITHKQQTKQEQRQEPPPKSGRGVQTWADLMFTALPDPLAEKAFKALTRVLHPDVGGSTEQMQILNAARDRFGRSK